MGGGGAAMQFPYPATVKICGATRIEQLPFYHLIVIIGAEFRCGGSIRDNHPFTYRICLPWPGLHPVNSNEKRSTVDYTINSSTVKHQFDFEIGYLIKSPCRECIDRDDFPHCAEDCNLLEKIHAVMMGQISCSRRN